MTEEQRTKGRGRLWLKRTIVALLLAIFAVGGAVVYGYYADQPFFWLGRACICYAWMPPVEYQPPTDRWRELPHTFDVLSHGGRLRVVMLGDSIIKDTSRSAWDLQLMRQNPRVTIDKITSVENAKGCWFYKLPGYVQKLVLDHKPDLVIIGGISNGGAGEVRNVVEQIRAGSDAEILLMTGAFGDGPDPTRGKDWRNDRPQDILYARQIETVAADLHCGFLDMQAAWGDYVSRAAKPLDFWKRDAVHSSAAGEQILGHILMQYLTPETTNLPAKGR